MALDTLLQVMADRGASDLHLLPDAAPHLRIEGDIAPFGPPLTRAAVRALLGELLDSRRRADFDATRDLTLAIDREGLGVFRVSLYRQRGHEAAVIRRIPAEVPDFASLDLPDALRALAFEPRGLVLVTGAAGSGRTTTVAAMLDARNDAMPGHVLTIEDPIEFRFRNRRSIFSQREIGTDTESYAAALRHAARQAPDCILVGEIRDAATLDAALDFAQSGRMVLSTLIAGDACDALRHLQSMLPPGDPGLERLSTGLRAIACQRLAPATEGGRRPIVELLSVSPVVREMIAAGLIAGIRDAMDRGLAPGSCTFDQALALRVRDGRMRREDAVAQSDSPAELERLLDHHA